MGRANDVGSISLIILQGRKAFALRPSSYGFKPPASPVGIHTKKKTVPMEPSFENKRFEN
ncbi:MAG: hypothetical protein M0P13_06245 [Fibrobacteraceae bacterium]|nr:hypothetical protein [Fibrobacteraceae bacterium]